MATEDSGSVMSTSQIHKLGERLAAGEPSKDDLERLDQYRRSFGPAYDVVKRALIDELGLPLSGRPQKTTESIIAKIQRERTSLPRMQDISGCRIVLPELVDQDTVVARICERFPGSRIIDRRARPSNGYRAVHVIVKASGRPIEVQVRTSLQDGWAQLSEKLSDIVGIDVKYGGGPDSARELLSRSSEVMGGLERLEREVAVMDRNDPKYKEASVQLSSNKGTLATLIQEALRTLDEMRRVR